MRARLLSKLLIVSGAVFMITSCASNNSIAQQAPFAKMGHVNRSASSYLNQAGQTNGDQRYQYQLLATTSMLQNGDANGARQLLVHLSKEPLQGAQKSYLAIMQAYYDVIMDRPDLAAQKLDTIGAVYALPHHTQILYDQVAYQAYGRTNRLAKSVIAQIKLAQFSGQQLSGDQQLFATAHVWRNLQNLSSDDLLSNANNSDPTVRGWFELALAARQHANQPDALVMAINHWHQTHPDHPANQIIPTGGQFTAATQAVQARQIALLLPLEGPFADTGKAIRDGFMTAYHTQGGANNPEIRVYDTTHGDIRTIYQQAVANGAELVIGPLTKNDVTRLATSGEVSVPTITLNYTDKPMNVPHLIQMGLSPQQAAEQVAQLAWHHGSNKVLSMTPEGAWGENIAKAFNAAFEAQGGKVIDATTFNQRNLSNQVPQLLGIRSSEGRAKQIEQLIGRRLDYMPHRRQDANGIFLVAAPVPAREIEPLFHFYFAGNLPVFSTSLIYNGYQDTMNNQDLNGTYFTDLPWIVSNSPDIVILRNQVANQTNYRTNSRFYGLGVDAFRLSHLFNRLFYLPNFAVNGVTGRLYLDGNQQIYSQLATAQIRAGQAVMIN